MSRVQLLVYDLTRGMASQLSQSILGARIDGVWHTGIQVFDIEYYYGGGIQASAVGIFAMSHSLNPVRVVDLGTTRKTRGELEEYLRSINNLFSPMSYDLLRNNCNNFTDTVSVFLTGQHIPPEHSVQHPWRRHVQADD
jgi:desumoylating isopeptidase 1